MLQLGNHGLLCVGIGPTPELKMCKKKLKVIKGGTLVQGKICIVNELLEHFWYLYCNLKKLHKGALSDI